MKKTTIAIILILFTMISFAQDEWTLIHPTPTLRDLKDTHFNTDQEGWVVGVDGLIMYTTDGGNTWETQHCNNDESFWSVFFIDDYEGWAAGWTNIYHTTDKGNTWVKQQCPVTYSNITDVYFINQNVGWASGTNNTILKTTDGGDNWTILVHNPSSGRVYKSIFFNDSLNGYVVGGETYFRDGIALKTTDGGATWTNTSLTDYHAFTKVTFLDSLTGWICGYGLLKTEDGGNTWEAKSSSIYQGSYSDIHFFDDNSGILLADHIMLKTFDAGETWDSIVRINTSSTLNKFSFWGNEGGACVGYYGTMYKSTDTCSNWEKLFKGLSVQIGNIGFFDSFAGYALTGYFGDGDLIYTNDGGYNWEYDTLIENGPFYKMQIKDQSIYLLNDSSQLMKSLNAGEDWELLSIPSDTSYYKDFQFVTENTAYMCSGEGILVKTTDGGHTWNSLTLNGNYVLNSIYFYNENVGWMLDYQARVILRTTNGGEDWSFSFLGDVYLFEPQSIFFINESEGFVTTDEGVLFNTVNGGETWEEYYVFSSGHNSEIYFINDYEGWYRTSGSLYHTYDGGVTWTLGQSNGFSYIRSMFFINNQGWIGGSHGLVAITNFTVGINESNNNIANVKVYPNPAQNDIVIKLNDKSDRIMDIKLFNILGKQIMHFPNLYQNNNFKINVSKLTAGAYIIHIRSSNGENLAKFIVQ